MHSALQMVRVAPLLLVRDHIEVLVQYKTE